MQPPSNHDLAYRPCVGIMLLNAHGQVWVGKRIPIAETAQETRLWQMPQGGIDENENPLDAAFRELKEETGIQQAELLEEMPNWLSYDLPKNLIGKTLKGYKGQRQKWFAMRFIGKPHHINIHKTNVPQEFSDWKWCVIEQLIDMVIPFKRKVYQQVVQHFRHLAP